VAAITAVDVQDRARSLDQIYPVDVNILQACIRSILPSMNEGLSATATPSMHIAILGARAGHNAYLLARGEISLLYNSAD